MAPLTIPQRPQGGLRAPFLDYPPGSVGAFESAGGAIYTGRLYCRASAPEARAVDVRACCGARRFAVARFCWKLVLRWGSFGEYVAGFLVFEVVGIVCSCSVATSASLGSSLASRADVVPCRRGRSFATSYKFDGLSSGSAVEVHASLSASFLLTFFWQGRKKSAAGGTVAVVRPPGKKR